MQAGKLTITDKEPIIIVVVGCLIAAITRITTVVAVAITIAIIVTIIAIAVNVIAVHVTNATIVPMQAMANRSHHLHNAPLNKQTKKAMSRHKNTFLHNQSNHSFSLDISLFITLLWRQELIDVEEQALLLEFLLDRQANPSYF